MKYLRMLIALLIGSAFFGFSVLISSIVGINIINQSNIGSSPLIFLIIISLIPFINITSFSWKNPLPKIDGIHENDLMLHCSYEKVINTSIFEAKIKIKDIANSLLFKDNELFQNYEDNNNIEFYLDVKERGELEKEKKSSIVYKKTLILVKFDEIDKDNTRVNIKIESDNPINVFANNFNREILNAIITEFNK